MYTTTHNSSWDWLMMIGERWHKTINDGIPPDDEYGRGIPDDERERRYLEEETVSIVDSIRSLV